MKKSEAQRAPAQRVVAPLPLSEARLGCRGLGLNVYYTSCTTLPCSPWWFSGPTSVVLFVPRDEASAPPHSELRAVSHSGEYRATRRETGMAYRVTFRGLLRPAHWHLSPSHQHRFIAPSAAHSFSHSAAARSGAGPDQASWDSIIDEADAFTRADNLPDTNSDSSISPSPSSQRPRRTTHRVYATQARQEILDGLPPRTARPSHAATSTPDLRRKQQQLKKRKKAEPAPELPPLEPLPTLDELHPYHYNELRLWHLQRTGRTPTTSGLETSLATWLRAMHRAQTRQRAIEHRQLELRAAKREALDLAWEWDRQVAVKSGIERTERELRKDAIVLRRLERRRIEKLEQAKRDAEDKQRKEREELDALIRAREAQKLAERKAAAEAEEEARLKRAPEWKKHQVTLREQFPSGWAPPKRLSREAMDLVRTMHAANPTLYSTAALAAQFKVSPEAIRRILKSRFEISKHEADRREARRKEARKAEVVGGGGQHGSSSVWGGNVAAEAREMETIRQTGGRGGGGGGGESRRHE